MLSADKENPGTSLCLELVKAGIPLRKTFFRVRNVAGDGYSNDRNPVRRCVSPLSAKQLARRRLLPDVDRSFAVALSGGVTISNANSFANNESPESRDGGDATGKSPADKRDERAQTDRPTSGKQTKRELSCACIQIDRKI